MSEPFIGEIRRFAGNFAPRGWAFCDGQLLSVSQNDALFSILGTTYGGDGRTPFGVPDLRGRAPMQQGNGPGLSSYRLGEKGGMEHVTLTTSQIPAHNHLVNGTSQAGDQPSPTGTIPGAETLSAHELWSDADSDGTMKDSMIQNTGGTKQHDNRQPYLVVNYIIALVGLYPSRN